jgi:hypothetical protein
MTEFAQTLQSNTAFVASLAGQRGQPIQRRHPAVPITVKDKFGSWHAPRTFTYLRINVKRDLEARYLSNRLGK